MNWISELLGNNVFVEVARAVPAESLVVAALLLVLAVIILSVSLILVSSSTRKVRDAIKFDRLTGLPMTDQFDEEAARLIREHHPATRFAFIYCDINRFKFINETYGYQEGDDLLCAMADMLRSFIDPDRPELVTRASADNFIILFSFTNTEDFHRRINASPLVKESEFHTRPAGYHVSISSGTYLLTYEDGPGDVDTCIVHAHYAKDQAKRLLKNNIVMYDARLKDHIAHEKKIENSMYNALEKGHFAPYFQAKTDIFTKKTVGAEALARWIDPDEGMISPGEFIPYFEKCGFVTTLDIHMFEKVCAQIAEWIARGYEPVRVSCNFSRAHIDNAELPQLLATIAERYRVPAELLEIEITESVAMDLNQNVLRFVHSLRRKGFKLAIDDFGTGFSSLSVLNQIEMDILKLDRTFFTESSSDEAGEIIVQSLVGLAHKLEIGVVCEGIETEDQIETMKSVDCRIAQGFYFSRPVPAAEFEKLLQPASHKEPQKVADYSA